MHTVKVISTTQETPDVKIIQLEKPAEFNFLPGQFIMLATGFKEKSVLVKRAYSIASSPQEKHIELCIKKKTAPSFSAALHELKQGDLLMMDGPFGKFMLKQPIKQNTIFIAGGTGISPIISMIKTMMQQPLLHKIQLYYSFHFPQDYIYKTELELLTKNNNLELFASMSAKEEFPEWTGLRGRTTVHLQNNIKNGANYEVYVCGPPTMVTDTIKQLISLGVKEENIHFEMW